MPIEEGEQTPLNDGLESRQQSVKRFKEFTEHRDIKSINKHPYLRSKRLSRFGYHFFLGKDEHGKFLGYPLFLLDSHYNFKLIGYGLIYDPKPETLDKSICVSAGTYACNAEPLARFEMKFHNQSIAENDVCYLCQTVSDALCVQAATYKDCYSCERDIHMKACAEKLSHRYKKVICCVSNDPQGYELERQLYPVKVMMPTKCSDFSTLFKMRGAQAVLKQLKTKRDSNVIYRLQEALCKQTEHINKSG